MYHTMLGFYQDGQIAGAARLARKIRKVLDSNASEQDKTFRIEKLVKKAIRADEEI